MASLNEQIVADLYRQQLGREPEPEGLSYWAAELDKGTMTVEQVAQAIARSSEGAMYDVNRLYQSELGRTPEALGLKSWSDALMSGSLDEAGLLNSIRAGDEYGQISVDQYGNQLNDLYKSEFGRDATPEDKLYWSRQLRSGDQTLANLPSVFNAKPEGVVFDLYNEILKRNPDPAAKGYVDALTAGTMTSDDLRKALMNSNERFAIRSQQAAEESKKALEEEAARRAAQAARIQASNDFYTQQTAALRAKAQEQAARGPFQPTAPIPAFQNVFQTTYNPANDPFMKDLPTGQFTAPIAPTQEYMDRQAAEQAAMAAAAPQAGAPAAFPATSVFAPQLATAFQAPALPAVQDASRPFPDTNIFYTPTT